MLKRLSLDDGTWYGLEDEWGRICQNYDEDFDAYMAITLPSLKNQCAECEGKNGKGHMLSHMTPNILRQHG